MQGKIAVEEHFISPELSGQLALELKEVLHLSQWRQLDHLLKDISEDRLRTMDANGVEMMVLSLTSPGVQAVLQPAEAVRIAAAANDHVASQIEKRRDRFRAFAALPMQDPDAAVAELGRCVRELGFVGALVNGYSQVGQSSETVYLSDKRYLPFWAEAEALDVPVYIHPREANPANLPQVVEQPWLQGPVWGFAVETATHAMLLMGAGLFDEHPGLRVVLGHLGEGLTFNMARADRRMSQESVEGNKKRTFSEYLRENFYFSVSGNYRSQCLLQVLGEVGADRLLFATDYPYEDMADAAGWFDSPHLPISETDRRKIGRENARKLFKLA